MSKTISELNNNAVKSELELRALESALGLTKDKTPVISYRVQPNWESEFINLVKEESEQFKINVCPTVKDIKKCINYFATAGLSRAICDYTEYLKSCVQIDRGYIDDVFVPLENQYPNLKRIFTKNGTMSCMDILKGVTSDNQLLLDELFKLMLQGVELEASASYISSLILHKGYIQTIAFDNPVITENAINLSLYTKDEKKAFSDLYRDLLNEKEQLQKNINEVRAKMYKLIEKEQQIHQLAYNEALNKYIEIEQLNSVNRELFNNELRSRKEKAYNEYLDKIKLIEKLTFDI